MPSYLVLEFLYISGFYKFGLNDIETLRLRFLSIALCCSYFFIPLSKLSPAPISMINWSYVKQKVLPNSIKNRFRPTFFLTTVRKNVTPRIVVSTHRGTTYEGVVLTVSTGCFQVRPHFLPQLRSGLICSSYILIVSTIIFVIFYL